MHKAKQRPNPNQTIILVVIISIILISGILGYLLLDRPVTVDYVILGNWYEVSRLDCETGTWAIPEDDSALIGEFVLRNDGTFDVTWHPFETYVDYSGEFTYTPSDKQLTLHPHRVNYLPQDIRGEGMAYIDADEYLILENIYLGTSYSGSDNQSKCGHRFASK